ncbi:endonuclease III [Candidatus Dependentiae bacterium]|nr:endonuclease III [Candidatus Dependentiae bacterium]
MDTDKLIYTLKKNITYFTPPLIDLIVTECGHDPFLILIACLLSLRAKDTATIHVCRVLFNRVRTPAELLSMDRQELESIIFKTGFYKNKAEVLQHVSAVLLQRFQGKVPGTYKELISIKGVGPKTANLVLGAGFNVPAICVDTHVHRISNRLGLIKTATVEETEQVLKKILPPKDWIVWNNILVVWGQNICVPISPKCSQCAVVGQCKRIGVHKSR